MDELSSPILIYGDRFISQNHINTIKSKYNKSYDINIVSSTESTLEYIEAISTSQGFIPQPKIIVINDLPNQKAVREFIIELTSRKNIPYTKFVIWDSSDSIKLDPKTKLPNKTWDDFISKFKCIDGSKIVNCGAEFTEKDDNEIASFIKTRFSKQNKEINSDAIKAFINIVGRDRGMITSEIDKLVLAAPIKITSEFIIENAFPSSKEAILFKLNNALDGTYSESIDLLEQFLESGINENVIAEIMAKKVRWQLVACHLYSKGMDWNDVERALMSMGKFPSVAWHNNKFSYDQKQKITEEYETEEGINKYRNRILGLPEYCFNVKESKKKKKKTEEDVEEKEVKESKAKKTVVLGKKECLPMPFLATQIVNGLEKLFITPNSSNLENIRVRMLNRAIDVYLFVIEKLKEIRYGDDPRQCVYEMVRAITNRQL